MNYLIKLDKRIYVLDFSNVQVRNVNGEIVSPFYGTSIMVGFAENGGMHQYQINDIHRTLFSTKPTGEINPSDGWTSEFLDWRDITLQNTKRKLNKNNGWNFLQGKEKVQGRLIGGCVEVLEFLKGTDYWPNSNEWDNKILFLETSEEMIHPNNFRRILRNYAAQGVFDRINGVIMGRPYQNKFVEEYNNIILQVIKEEQGNDQLTIVTEMDFGHTCPVFTIPYGIMAEIDSNKIFVPIF